MPPSQLLAEYRLQADNDSFSRRNRVSTGKFLKSTQWSADGTCIISNASDNIIRTLVILPTPACVKPQNKISAITTRGMFGANTSILSPPDLLEEKSAPQKLEVYTAIKSSESVDAIATYPYFDLQAPETNLALLASNEHPIQLRSLATTQLLASYPLVNPTTEAFVKPTSLLFDVNGSQFLAGSESHISIFDVARPGEDAVVSLETGPKKANSYTSPGTSMRGRVSALAVDQQHNILAAGTYGRQIGLYDSGGRGECLGCFSVAETEADTAIHGQGITQLWWSSCGRHLFIAERKSDGIMFYDIRKSGQLLGWVEGRNARSNQRMSFDLFQNPRDESLEIWAGGLDGYARMWKDVTLHQGRVAAAEATVLHADAINSVQMHKSGSVLATASGQRHFYEDTGQSSLRLWEM